MWGDMYVDARENAEKMGEEPTKENLKKRIYGNAAVT